MQRAVAMDAGYVEAHYQLFKIQSGIGDFASARQRFGRFFFRGFGVADGMSIAERRSF